MNIETGEIRRDLTDKEKLSGKYIEISEKLARELEETEARARALHLQRLNAGRSEEQIAARLARAEAKRQRKASRRATEPGAE